MPTIEISTSGKREAHATVASDSVMQMPPLRRRENCPRNRNLDAQEFFAKYSRAAVAKSLACTQIRQIHLG